MILFVLAFSFRKRAVSNSSACLTLLYKNANYYFNVWLNLLKCKRKFYNYQLQSSKEISIFSDSPILEIENKLFR